MEIELNQLRCNLISYWMQYGCYVFIEERNIGLQAPLANSMLKSGIKRKLKQDIQRIINLTRKNNEKQLLAETQNLMQKEELDYKINLMFLEYVNITGEKIIAKYFSNTLAEDIWKKTLKNIVKATNLLQEQKTID